MDKIELKEKLIKIIIGIDQGEPYWEVVDKILALIAPVPDTDSKEQLWRITELKIKTKESRCRFDFTNDRQREKMVKTRLDTGNWEISEICIKNTQEVYKIDDKIVWNWQKCIGAKEYVTIESFKQDKDGLYMTIASAEYIYRPKELQEWGLRHYQAPEPVQEEKVDMEIRIDGVDEKVRKYKVTLADAKMINTHLLGYQLIDQRDFSAPVEKEPEVVDDKDMPRYTFNQLNGFITGMTEGLSKLLTK